MAKSNVFAMTITEGCGASGSHGVEDDDEPVVCAIAICLTRRALHDTEEQPEAKR